jgi:hypothetical protein
MYGRMADAFRPAAFLVESEGRMFNARTGKPVVPPRFRNDDVSWETPLDQFSKFCHVFRKFRLRQVHGITIYGSTRTVLLRGGTPVQYEGVEDIAKVPNSKIRELALNECFEQRTDIIGFLSNSIDEIALHGLFHTDYSMMDDDEQRKEIGEGLRILGRIFPRKEICYFIAPFNKTGEHTAAICGEFGLDLLAGTGVHLEEQLHRLRIVPDTWYRYHHHRFYRESTFTYYKLSVQSLERAFSKNFRVAD